MAAERSFLPTAEAVLELVCAGPWAAAPSHWPRSCVANKGAGPLALGFMSPPWSPVHLLCLALLPVLLGLLTINVSILAVAQPLLPLPMGCEGVFSSCSALGREREWGGVRGA